MRSIVNFNYTISGPYICTIHVPTIMYYICTSSTRYLGSYLVPTLYNIIHEMRLLIIILIT